MRPHYRPAFAVLLPFVLLGCNCPSHRAERTEEFELTATEANRLLGRTHNGSIRIVAGAPEIVRGRARIVGAGSSAERAAEIRDRIVLRREVRDGTVDIGWDWSVEPGFCESGYVEFELAAPPDWQVDLESHNGDLTIEGVGAGGVRLETHNGDVVARGVRGRLQAETHNGDVDVADVDGHLDARTHNGDVAASGDLASVAIVTHNGRVGVAADGSGPLAGSIESHNGSVRLALGDRDAHLEVDTHNGDLDLDTGPDARFRRLSDDAATVVVGAATADAPLRVRTWNGDVRVRSGDRATEPR